VVVSEDGRVGVRADGTSVGFAGLETCGSVWACPVCNARVQAKRRLEVGVALATLHANGGGAAFGAITVRHRASDSLAGLLTGLTYGISRIAQDKTVKAVRQDMGYLGRVQALEVTHGRHGWHPHRHPLVMFSRPVTPVEVSRLHAAEFRAFSAGVVKKGLHAPLADGQSLRPVSLDGAAVAFGEYFTKAAYKAPERLPGADEVAWEVTGAQGKKGRQNGSRGIWEVLNGVMAGDGDDLDLWHEYEEATRGKRALVWSRGLRSALGLDDEASDEDIAAEEVGHRDDTGFWILDWGNFRAQPALGPALLAAVGPAGDWEAGREFCRRYGVPFEDNDA